MKIKLIVGYVALLFLYYSWRSTIYQEYYTSKGKVVDFETITVKRSGYKGHRVYITKHMPVIEYFYKGEKLVYTYGKDYLINNLNINDEIPILVNKKDNFDIIPKTAFFYWLTFPDLLVISLLLIMYTGIIKVFFNN